MQDHGVLAAARDRRASGIDAVPFLIERKGPDVATRRATTSFLHDLRDFLQWRRRDAHHARRGERAAATSLQ